MDSLLLAGLSNTAWATALAVAVAAIGKVCGHRQPALLHALWLLVLVKLLTPSLVAVDPSRFLGARLPEPHTEANEELVLGSPGAPGSPPVPQSRPTGVSDPQDGRRQGAGASRSLSNQAQPFTRDVPLHWLWSWQATVAGIWLVGSIAWCSAVALGILRFRRLIRSARPASDELRTQIDRMAEKLGLRRVPKTFVVPARIPPMLWALVGRPRLILPEDLWDRLSVDERNAILAHELAHLKRRDEWARRLEAVTLGLYWWNPVAWWARREVERTEEQCCDAWVLWALPDSASAYARALVRTADFLSESNSRHPWPAGASGAGHLPPLKRRLTMILNSASNGANPSPRSVSRPVLILAGLSLLLLPAWALSDPPEPEPVKLDRSNEPAKVETPPKPAAKAPMLDAPPEIADKVKFAQVISSDLTDKQQYVGSLVATDPIMVHAPREGKIKFLHGSGLIVEKGAPLLQFVSDDKGEKATDVIGSPALGIISYGQLFPGSQGLRPIKDVKRGQPLLFIRPTDSISVDYHLDQSTYLKLKRQKLSEDQKSALTLGEPVEVIVGGDSAQLQGQVVSVESKFDPKSGTLRCRASFPNPDGIFIPGMSAAVIITTGAPQKVLLLPRNARLKNNLGHRLLVVNDADIVELRKVRVIGDLRLGGGNQSYVAEGLKEGDWVVTDGYELVKPGMKVKR